MMLTAAAAQKGNDASVIQRINSVASQIKTMQCSFVQTKYMKMLNDKMVSYGRMYYQQGNKLRWEYTSPYTYTFILNNNQVLLKKGNRSDRINVSQSKFFKEIVRIMMNSVVGKCLSDKKDFRVSIASTSTEWIATMLPQRREMRQMFKKIIVHFSCQKSMVTTVELIEKNGDRTIIRLKNIRTNAPINAKVFSLN